MESTLDLFTEVLQNPPQSRKPVKNGHFRVQKILIFPKFFEKMFDRKCILGNVFRRVPILEGTI